MLIDSLTIEEYLSENNIEAQEIDNGIYYTLEEEGNGQYPQEGDYVMIHYTGKLLNGKVFDESETDNPFVFRIGYRIVIQGWDKGIPNFPVGSKGTLYIPAEMAFGASEHGAIPANSSLIFNIEVLKIMNADAYDRYMIEQEKRERMAYEKHKKDQLRKDKKLIHEYAAENKIRTKRTPSGLSYAITKKGKGEKAEPGDILKVHYEGFLLDGTPFDSSYKTKKPFEFVLGRGKVIQGWEEGFQFFQKGSEGWLLIPSKLAYGRLAINEDDIKIPADSALAFKVKVLSINKTTANK